MVGDQPKPFLLEIFLDFRDLSSDAVKELERIIDVSSFSNKSVGSNYQIIFSKSESLENTETVKYLNVSEESAQTLMFQSDLVHNVYSDQGDIEFSIDLFVEQFWKHYHDDILKIGKRNLKLFPSTTPIELNIAQEKVLRDFLYSKDTSLSFGDQSKSLLKVSISNYFKIADLNDSTFLLPIDEGQYCLFHLKESTSLSAVDYRIEIATYYREIKKMFNLSGENLKLQSELNDDLNFLNLLEYGVVGLNSDNDIVFYNDRFLKFSYTGDKFAELDKTIFLDKSSNKKYYVERFQHKYDVDHMWVYLFIPIVLSDSHLEELGIISSSLAHELNNPLAGMLATTEVILLETLKDEDREIVREIENTLKRSKNMVSLFLSFSRYRQEELLPLSTSLLESSIEQALSLLRSRLMENNFQLIVEQTIEPSFYRKVDASSFTIFLYLFFNEVLTNLSHQKLIDTENISSIPIKLSLVDSQITISFDNEKFVPTVESLDHNDFLIHLLKQQKITINQYQGQIVLVWEESQ